jgi:3-oxosteroid 1-dehydrogenase
MSLRTETPLSKSAQSDVAVEVDALIVGAGAAGMTAALVAALEGLDVLLSEKSGQVGGSSATSAGTIWVPGTRA